MELRSVLTATALVLGTAAQSATLGEEKQFVINPLDQQTFEVIRLRHMGPTELWCAAASYVEARRGLSGTTMIYISNALAPARTVQGREGVIFSLSNAGLPAADPNQISITVDKRGAAMKSAAARRFCRDAFTRSTK